MLLVRYSNNILSDSTSMNAERIVGQGANYLWRGPSDVVSVVENPLSGSRQDDEDPLHAEGMVGRETGYHGQVPSDTSVVALNLLGGNRPDDKDPQSAGKGNGGSEIEPRHLECNSTGAGVVAHETLDVDCLDSSASANVGQNPWLVTSKLRYIYLVKPRVPVRYE